MTTVPMINDKRETRGWMLYDFANSAFSTTVITVFLGPYLTGLIESQVGNKGTFTLLGIPIAAESFFTYCVSHLGACCKSSSCLSSARLPTTPT